jgi:hypothetical protein
MEVLIIPAGRAMIYGPGALVGTAAAKYFNVFISETHAAHGVSRYS